MTETSDFPKWVTPHASHVVKQGDNLITPLFPDFHVARDQSVTVLVKDAEEEMKALAAKIEAKEPKADAPKPAADTKAAKDAGFPT